MAMAVHGGVARIALALGACGVLVAGWAEVHAAPVLDVEGSTLTTYKPASKTRVQDLRPLPQQRGVGIDGGVIAPAPQGWAVAADTISGGVQGGRRLGSIDLLTMTYGPTEVDLALPTLGPPVVIGRTYNNRQVTGSSRFDSDGYQGRNWSQLAQPEIVFFDADSNAATLGADDCVYLVYGADRYIEFKRTGATHTEFKAKNGAAGVMQFIAGGSAADEYHYHDAAGNEVVFFGWNSATASGGKDASGQWWKTIDAAGKVAFVGHATNSATAISGGYETGGQIKNITDASGRVYTFTHTSGRLASVVATVSTTTVGTVEYTYHSGSTAHGSAGDLETVKVTMPMGTSTFYVTETYYRYYKGTYNSSTNRGTNHWLKGAVGREGVRKADLAGTSPAATIDGSHKTMADTDLKPYSEAWVEYTNNSGKEGMIDIAVLGGQCGCSGGANGTFNFSTDVGSATLTDTTYQTAWAFRTVIDQPDTTWVTQYFDEVGQPLARVTTNADPATSPTKTWVSDIVRNSSGIVTAMRSPASIDTSTYTHSTGAFTARPSAGLITKFTLQTTGDLTGLRLSTAVVEGDSGTPTTVGSVTHTSRTRSVGTNGSFTVPFVDSSSSYPSGSAITTTITITNYWDDFNDSVAGYIVPLIVRVNAPAVSTANNGANSTTSSFTYHRSDGSVAFTKDGAGIFSYSGRNAYGQTSRTVADANPASTDIFTEDDPATWALPTVAAALHIKSDMTFDAQGRMLTVTRPSVNGTRLSGQAYTPLSDGTYAVQSYPRYDTASGNYYGPVQTTIYNQANQPEISGTVAIVSAGVSLLPSPGYDSSTWSAVTTHQYDEAGAKRLSSRSYTSLPGGLPGSSTDYDQTSFGYDNMGRTIRVADATGTIRTTTFDDLGRPTESWIGTDDSTGGSNNMTKTETREYDGGPSASGGNSFLTKVTQDADGNWSTTTDQRVSTMVHDFRGRVLVRNNPVSPHQRMKYDNADRTIAVGGYSATATSGSDPTSTATARLSLSETSYDERGQVFRTVRHEVTQSTGALGSSITDNTWYDAVGRTVATAGSRITKTQYDRLGRGIGSFLIAKTDDSSYSDRLTVTGDIVVQESWTGLHAGTGLPLVRHTVDRNHDDGLTGTTGALNTDGANSLNSIAVGSGSVVKGRVQITATWYDDLDRVQDTVALGTNGGSTTYTRSGASVPGRSDTALRTTYTYDNYGRVSDITDPGDAGASGGRIQRTEYDAAGRRLRVIDNYTNGTPGGGTNNDEDRVVEYTYGTGGRVTAVTRKMTSSADDQTTTYTYGVVKSGTLASAIASGHLLKEIILPEQTSGQSSADRTILYAYNALGQTTATKDAAGNIIDTAYDVGGRPITRTASTVASGFDNRVLTIETSYTSRGQVDTVTQKGASAVVRDQLDFRYDGWGNIDRMRQDPDSAIGASSGRDEFETTYTYTLANGGSASTGGWSTLDLTSMTQPGNTLVEYYKVAGVPAEYMGLHTRVDVGGLQAASYTHMGAGTVAAVKYEEPNVAARMYDWTGGSSSYGSYIDRFTRVTRNTWAREISGSGITTPVFYDAGAELTRFGAAATKQDEVLKLGTPGGTPGPTRVFDVASTFDGLRRLNDSDQGELGGTPKTIATRARRETLDRDLAGNISRHRVDLNGDADYTDGPVTAKDLGEMDDTRTYNKRHELRTRVVKDFDNPSGATLTLAYNLNGQLTDDGQKYTYVYNPWGQLVEVKNRGTATVRGRFTYNGLGMKISEQEDTNRAANDGVVDGAVDSNDPVFYLATDLMGRRVATYRGDDTDPKQTMVYHASMQSGPMLAGGGPILRDRNKSLSDPALWATETADATRGERYYYCANHRGRIAALIDHNGQLVEQYRYSPTCVPYLIIAGDVNADGVVNATDDTLLKSLYTSSATYEPRADLNLDGKVDADDDAIRAANDGTQGGRASMNSVRLRDGMYDTDVFVGARSVGTVSFDQCAAIAHASTARLATVSAAVAPRLVQQNCPRDYLWDFCATRVPSLKQRLDHIWARIERYCGANPVCSKLTIKCERTRGNPNAYFTPSDCEIVLQWSPPDHDGVIASQLCDNLAHELTHAAQYCMRGRLPPTCDSNLCAELDAYYSAGQCFTLDACCAKACESSRTDRPSCYGGSAAQCLQACRTLAAGRFFGPNWPVNKRDPFFLCYSIGPR